MFNKKIKYLEIWTDADRDGVWSFQGKFGVKVGDTIYLVNPGENKPILQIRCKQ
jgi:hypothetical protein